MCLVDMCGACSAKCVSYAELGAGLNKVLGAVGLSSEPAAPHPFCGLCLVFDCIQFRAGLRC